MFQLGNNSSKINNSKSITSEISSNKQSSSVSSSSLSRINSNYLYEDQFLSPHVDKTLGISSLTLKSSDSVKKSTTYDLNHKSLSNNNNNIAGLSLTPTFKTNGINSTRSNRMSNKLNNKATRNETPLLSNLLLQHSARF